MPPPPPALLGLLLPLPISWQACRLTVEDLQAGSSAAELDAWQLFLRLARAWLSFAILWLFGVLVLCTLLVTLLLVLRSKVPQVFQATVSACLAPFAPTQLGGYLLCLVLPLLVMGGALLVVSRGRRSAAARLAGERGHYFRLMYASFLVAYLAGMAHLLWV